MDLLTVFTFGSWIPKSCDFSLLTEFGSQSDPTCIFISCYCGRSPRSFGQFLANFLISLVRRGTFTFPLHLCHFGYHLFLKNIQVVLFVFISFVCLLFVCLFAVGFFVCLFCLFWFLLVCCGCFFGGFWVIFVVAYCCLLL